MPGCQNMARKGREYTGYSSTTVSGRVCQRWEDSEPHHHRFTSLADNYCRLHSFLLYPLARNPDGEPGGLWCYTTDPGVRWEYCQVPPCQRTGRRGPPRMCGQVTSASGRRI